MLVKCWHCKDKKIDRDTAFKVPGKKINKYYCNQSEYEFDQQKKQIREQIQDEIDNIFEYAVRNTALYKEWAVWNELASDQEIYDYICNDRLYLRQIMQRRYKNEYSKIRYFSSIITNHIRDYIDTLAMIPEVQVAEDFEFYEPKKNKKNKRRGLASLEEDQCVD